MFDPLPTQRCSSIEQTHIWNKSSKYAMHVKLNFMRRDKLKIYPFIIKIQKQLCMHFQMIGNIK